MTEFLLEMDKLAVTQFQLQPSLHFVLRCNERQNNFSNFTLSSLKDSLNIYATQVLCKANDAYLHLPKYTLLLTPV